jgi:hypothetical protein
MNMQEHASKGDNNRIRIAVEQPVRESGDGGSAYYFADNRPEFAARENLQAMAKNSPRVSQLKALQKMADDGGQAGGFSRLQSMTEHAPIAAAHRLLTQITAQQLSRSQPRQLVANTGGVLQGKFDQDGEWMQEVDDATLLEKFGQTTASLWKALRDLDSDLAVKAQGSGANFNFETFILSIASDWLRDIKKYVDDGTKADGLDAAVSSLTHEMSHAHDRFVKKESPRGKSKETDAYVAAVLKTELRAWMKEARSARENSKEKGINLGDVNNQLIIGWLGVHYTIADGKDILAADEYKNPVVGRLKKYFNDNKSTETTTTLAELLADASNGLLADLTNYAGQIRAKFTSGDGTLRGAAAAAMG